MTEEQIKEMYLEIINNSEKWECRCQKQECCSDCAFSCIENKIWQPYKLGEGIHEDWEYRKVEKWYVVKETNQTFNICPYEKAKQYNPIHFEGTKEECEKWIEEHTKKTWLEERFPLGLIVDDLHMEGEKERLGATEVCKKILEEVRNNCFDSWLPVVRDDVGNVLEHLIKELGIEI